MLLGLELSRIHGAMLATSRRSFARFAGASRSGWARGMLVHANMATMPFPHHYTVDLSDNRLAAEPRDPIAVGAPPQFGGTNDVWSPEELLVGAVLLCVKTTFDAFARKAELAIHSWAGKGTGILDKGPAGAIFTSIQIDLDIETGRGAESRARDLLHSVKRACIISRAIAAPVDIVANVRGRE